MSRFRHAWAVALVALFLVPSFAMAQFKAGDFELTLTGQGTNGPDFDGFSAGATVGIGYFATDALELAVRQNVSYNDINGTSTNRFGVGGGRATWSGTTAVAADINFPGMGKFVPFIGANIGYTYGSGDVNDTFVAGPEGGIKWFLTDTAFVQLIAQYEFNFDKGSSSSAFSDGAFIYGLGIGTRL